MPFLAPLMLLGLAAISIPPIIHLLNRRRFQVVDWGAMQFLQISETTRRRLLIEEVLLMLLRMGLIGVMVVMLAGPLLPASLFAGLGSRPPRDVVLIFDGSYSMGYTGTGQSAHDAAKEWAIAFVDDLSVGDSVAILQAKQQVIPVLAEPTHDLRHVREVIAKLPAPSGGCDWPEAVKAARKILAEKSQRSHRDIVILGDGQRHGWADETSLLGWSMLANQPDARNNVEPRTWVVNVEPNRPDDPPNWSVAPIRSSRAVVGKNREVLFRTALGLRGKQAYQPPYKLRLEIDGQPAGELPAPQDARLEKGQVPLTFTRRFPMPGSHLVSVIVEPDPPLADRPAGYSIKDQLPGDNRQDFAVEVVSALPVLLVDGDDRPPLPTETKPRDRGADFLRDALAPAIDTTPVVMARVVPIQDFRPELLTKNLGKEPGTQPRVLVLSNVARLTQQQNDAVAKFAEAGGGVLVTLGERVDASHYNEQLHRGGQGWLPARLEDIHGDEVEMSRAVQPLASSFFHPALELFRDAPIGGLPQARFPRWWKVTTPGKGSTALPIAQLTNADPFLVERPFHNGRVILCVVPLDNSWRTNLASLPAFPPLTHELIFYLAGAGAARHNLQPGQTLRYQPPGNEPPGPVLVRPPVGEPKELRPEEWPLDYAETRETGIYRIEDAGHASYFVVQPDPRESNLASCTAADRDKVAKLVPMTYKNERQDLQLDLVRPNQPHEVWLWFLLGVIALLCGEVWLTRRIALNR